VERDRAIVTASPGTTRDLVSERISIGGIPIELVDTAGFREGAGQLLKKPNDLEFAAATKRGRCSAGADRSRRDTTAER